MGKIMNPSRYPKQYLDLAIKFEDGATEVTVEFESEQAAKDFRSDFYGFRAAAEKEGMTGQHLDTMYPKLNNLMLKFEPPNKMVLILRDSCSFAQAIDKALARYDAEQAGKAFVKEIQ